MSQIQATEVPVTVATTTPTLSWGTTPTSGNQGILLLGVNENVGQVTVTAPTGWTLRHDKSTTGNHQHVYCYTRTLDGTGNDTPAPTFSASTTAIAYLIERDDIADLTTFTATDGESASTVTAFAMTESGNTPAADSIAYAFYAYKNGSGTASSPTDSFTIADQYASGGTNSDIGGALLSRTLTAVETIKPDCTYSLARRYAGLAIAWEISTGPSTFTGTAESTLPSIGQDAAGTNDSPVAWVFRLTVTDNEANTDETIITVLVALSLTGNSVLPAITQNATGGFTGPSIATIASVLPAVTQDAVGTWTDPVDTGTIASTLPAITQDASGTVTTPSYDGTISSVLPQIDQAASGDFGTIYTGTATSVLSALDQAATGMWIDPSSSRISVRHRTRAAGLSGSYTTLSLATKKKFFTELSTPGSFSVQLPLNDPALANIGDGDYIQFLLDGTVRFTGVYDRKKSTILHPNNEISQTAVLTGMSLVGEWKQAIVRGPTAPDSDLWGTVRHFDWSSPELDDTAWSNATQLYQQDSAPGDPKKGKPLGFPYPDGYWIWSTTHAGDYLYGPGISPFRGGFTLATDASVAIYIAADDGFLARLDGVDLGGNGKVNGWETVWRADVDLAAGTHLLAVLAENYDRLVSTNTAGLIVAVFTLDDTGRDDTYISGTSSGTKTMHYPATLPGFTVGHVLRILLEENQAEGALIGWTLDCTDTLDADGVAWPTDQAFSFDVGRDLLSVLEELSSTHIDYVIDNSTKTLHVYNIDGAGAATSQADLTNYLLELVDDRQAEITNSLLVQYAKGQFTVENAGSVAIHGNRWDFLMLGAVENRAQALTMAQQEVDRLASARPRITAPLAGRLLDANSVNPFAVWDVGDYVTLPNSALVATDYRVLGIAVEENDNAVVTVTPTLNSRAEEASVRLVRAIERMERGTMKGKSQVSSPPRESESVRVRKVEVETVPVSLPGEWADSAYLNKRSSPYKPNQPGKFVWAEYVWDTDPTTTVEINVEIGGSVVATHTLPAATTTVDIYPNLEVERTKIIAIVTDDDADAVGLTGKWHFMRFI